MLTRVRVGREDDDGGTKASPGAARAAVTTTTRTRSRIVFSLVPVRGGRWVCGGGRIAGWLGWVGWWVEAACEPDDEAKG